jgi:hypothetical protein
LGQEWYGETIEDYDNMGKLGQGFTPVDDLEEVDLGDSCHARPTYINAGLSGEQKDKLCCLLKEFVGCFTWDYNEMLGFSRELVEHMLSINSGSDLISSQTKVLARR